jgi:isopenicillin-N epimerase
LNENLASQFLLEEGITFLNHGSFGACPKPVFETYQRWQLKLERQPVAFLDPNRGLSGWMRDSRVALAGELGTAADNLVGVMNATYGLNIVAQSLDLKEGDEILTTDHEYAALEKTWAYVARRTGAKIISVTIPLPLTLEESFTSTLKEGITNRTRVIFLSHITSATALVFPIENIVAEARMHGIITVIDGAHTPGHIPLNLDALGADYYAGNCHKWMMAPKGSAFLYVRPELQSMINPLVISHGWTANHANPAPFGGTPFIDSIEMQGTRDPAAWLTVPDAIAFRTVHHWDMVAADCRRLVQDTAQRVAAWTGLPAFASPVFCAPQMVAMPIPECEPLQLQKKLWSDYKIEIPCFKWKNQAIARVSAQGYNQQTHMDLLVNALKDILS